MIVLGRLSQVTVRGGRPERVVVKCSAEQKAALKAHSVLAGVSMGKFLMDAALGEQSDSVMSAVERRELLAAVGRLQTELVRVGTNLNQLARAANVAGDAVRDGRDLPLILGEVDQALLQATRLFDSLAGV